MADALAYSLGTVPGCNVVGVAYDAREAVRLVRTMKPDLLLIDYHLPDVDGAVAVRSVRALGLSLRVVVLTANESKLVQEQCVRSGADCVISKSKGLDAIAEALAIGS